VKDLWRLLSAAGKFASDKSLAEENTSADVGKICVVGKLFFGEKFVSVGKFVRRKLFFEGKFVSESFLPRRVKSSEIFHRQKFEK
jgi:hypothetical protein